MQALRMPRQGGARSGKVTRLVGSLDGGSEPRSGAWDSGRASPSHQWARRALCRVGVEERGPREGVHACSPFHMPGRGSPKRPRGPEGHHPGSRTPVLAARPPSIWRPRCRLLGQGARPPHPFHVPPGWSLGNAEDTPSPPRGHPTACMDRGGAGADCRPLGRWGAGAGAVGEGSGLGRGARCSPAKAPTAFLMSSTLSKSVIDILQLFERAEQVQKD